MKIYTYSNARENLASVLEKSKVEEIIIQRRKGDMFSIVPKNTSINRSPFDVNGLKKKLPLKIILSALRESRKRS